MTIVTIVGARPQFIKLAPVSRALRQDGHREIIVHTGQHYDANLSDLFFTELGLPAPDYNLAVGSGNHGFQTGEMLRKIEMVLLAEQPKWVMVYGDTNSTVAGALAASKLHIPVAHVEAGLRSFNRKMPEEINRVLTDHMSSLLFCPTDTAVRHLTREGISQGVHLVGDVMLDALMTSLDQAMQRSTILKRLALDEGRYLLATIHRPENTEQPGRLRQIFAAFKAIEKPVVFPMHPRTGQKLADLAKHGEPIEMPSNVRVVPPLGHLDLIRVAVAAKLIMTDSGGLQKEAFWLRVPCVTLRDETEWIETVDEGWNVVTGADTERILQHARLMMDRQNHRINPALTPVAAAAIARIFSRETGK